MATIGRQVEADDKRRIREMVRAVLRHRQAGQRIHRDRLVRTVIDGQPVIRREGGAVQADRHLQPRGCLVIQQCARLQIERAASHLEPVSMRARQAKTVPKEGRVAVRVAHIQIGNFGA